MKRQSTIVLLQILLALAVVSSSFGQTEAAGQLVRVSSQEIPFKITRGAFAVWQQGSFVYVKDRFSAAPIVQIFTQSGRQTSTFTFSIPKASLINLYDNSIALGRDGSLALTGTAFSDDLREGMFLAWVSPNREEQTIIRISPFFPRAVALASDGTIWLAGDESKPNHQIPDYSQHLIRHYDKTGRLLGSFVSWSDFQTDSPTHSAALRSLLIPLGEGIAWYSPLSNSYVELTSDGAIIKRLKTGPHANGDLVQATGCTDGNIYASTRIPNADNNDEFHWGIYILNPREGTWTLRPTGDKWGILFGCDGTRLATTSDFKTVTWISSPSK